MNWRSRSTGLALAACLLTGLGGCGREDAGRVPSGETTVPMEGAGEEERKMVLTAGLAGTWYEAEPTVLRAQLAGWIAEQTSCL